MDRRGWRPQTAGNDGERAESSARVEVAQAAVRQAARATYDAIGSLGVEVMHNSATQMFTKGVVAGWLIATMVWLIPAVPESRVLVIAIMTWMIGVGGFTHIVVGSTEVLYLVFDGQLAFGHYLWPFALPTLAGNIVGGSLIFALISHAQVRSDEEERKVSGRVSPEPKSKPEPRSKPKP